jgi:ABC-type phosphate transport system substrate-binding protein
MTSRLLRITATAPAATLLALCAATAAAQPARAGSYVAISGSGSTWSAVALDQWQQDLRPSGVVVNYNPDGSAAGRADYMANQDDFAASDPPFRNGHDQLGGTGAEHPTQGFSYIPDTAGGTAFMYHIEVAGHLLTNLRLTGLTIMKIFTGQITNWDDPAVTKDAGQQLPNLPITPVIRSDGSGATYFLTRWMSHVYPTQWNAFCKKVRPSVTLPCGQTEFYPLFPGAKSENGSDNVATYITASYGNGAIGYDEYAYALNAHYPVVKMLNPAGYYVLPTASNVAVALTKAVINEHTSSPDFLQQNLDSVYSYNDPRSYPLSSYSYLVVPRHGTQQPTNFSAAKGKTLSTFINYLLCAGQREVAALGYSPLPLNLVTGGLLQVNKIPGHVSASISNCPNPTFTNGVLTLLTTAPQPSPCDKFGEPLNCVVVNGKATKPGAGGGTPSPGASSVPAPTGVATAPATGSTGPAAGAPVPVTGQVVLVSANSPNKLLLSALVAVMIVIAVIVPPMLGHWLRRRRQQAAR